MEIYSPLNSSNHYFGYSVVVNGKFMVLNPSSRIFAFSLPNIELCTLYVTSLSYGSTSTVCIHKDKWNGNRVKSWKQSFPPFINALIQKDIQFRILNLSTYFIQYLWRCGNFMCVCVCVCERERGKKSGEAFSFVKSEWMKIYYMWDDISLLVPCYISY